MDRWDDRIVAVGYKIIGLNLPGVLCIPVWWVLKKCLEIVWHLAAIWMCYIIPITHDEIYEFLSAKLGHEPSENLIYFLESGQLTSWISYGIILKFRYQIYALFDWARELCTLIIFLFGWFLCFTVYRREFPFIF